MSGDTKQTQNSSSQSSPWAPQAGALTAAFNNAQTAYGTSSQAVAPTNFTAGMTPDQLASFRSMIGYGNSNAGATNGQMTAGNTLATNGAAGASGALTSLGGFNPSASNNPQSLIDSANKFVAGQNIPGQVDNAMLGARQQVRDVTLPQMTSGAAMGGNINSSAAGPGGTAQGVVERGLAEQAAAMSGDMQGKAFGTGLNLAENQNTNNNAAIIAALTGAGNVGNTSAATGGALTSGAVGNAGGIYNIANTGGAGQQANTQADLTNKLQQFQSGTSSPFASLQQLMSIIGSNNWGSNTNSTGTTTSTPSAFSTIGGLLGAGGSLLGSSGGIMGGGSGLLGLAALSDRNMKDDIVQIGTLFDGQPVYRFRYKGERKVNIGLMAQDVEKLIPEAILEMGGVKYVNYDTATKHISNAPILA